MATKKDYVSIVGGVNIDIQGFPKSTLVPGDSNPGEVKVSLGGVGRNIGENLVKLGVRTKLISVLGDDDYGQKVLQQAAMSGLEMDGSQVLKGQSTSTYLSILDHKRDMAMAISHMDIFDMMDIEFIRSRDHIIKNSKLCVIDTNIPAGTIEYIVMNHMDTDFFLDTVSTAKAGKVRDIIGLFHTIKPNRLETEVLTGIKIKNEEDMKRASAYLLDTGVRRVFISLGEMGVYYDDGISRGLIPAPQVKMVNATGAGDAFMAGLALCYLNGYGMEYSTRFAMAAAVLALSHEDTINPGMSLDNIIKMIKEMGLC